MKRKHLSLERKRLVEPVQALERGLGANGMLLQSMLPLAVFMRMDKYKSLSAEERAEKAKALNEVQPSFCEQMEFVMHKGKDGQSANAFNLLAEAIALLSFSKNGVTAFGSHYDAAELPNPTAK